MKFYSICFIVHRFGAGEWEWIGWFGRLDIWSDDWSVVSCQLGVLVIYAVSAILGHWQRQQSYFAKLPIVGLTFCSCHCRCHMPHGNVPVLFLPLYLLYGISPRFPHDTDSQPNRKLHFFRAYIVGCRVMMESFWLGPL